MPGLPAGKRSPASISPLVLSIPLILLAARHAVLLRTNQASRLALQDAGSLTARRPRLRWRFLAGSVTLRRSASLPFESIVRTIMSARLPTPPPRLILDVAALRASVTLPWKLPCAARLHSFAQINQTSVPAPKPRQDHLIPPRKRGNRWQGCGVGLANQRPVKWGRRKSGSWCLRFRSLRFRSG